MARARRYEDETVLERRRNRRTGTCYAIVYDYGVDPAQPWETICEEHGGVCSHESRALARSFLAVPEEWCADCARLSGTRG